MDSDFEKGEKGMPAVLDKRSRQPFVERRKIKEFGNPASGTNLKACRRGGQRKPVQLFKINKRGDLSLWLREQPCAACQPGVSLLPIPPSSFLAGRLISRIVLRFMTESRGAGNGYGAYPLPRELSLTG